MKRIAVLAVLATLVACGHPPIERAGVGGVVNGMQVTDPTGTLAASVVEAGVSTNGIKVSGLAGSITLGGDVTGPANANLLSGIAGSSPIPITPANLQYTAATTSPLLSQATQTSDIATNDITIQSQGPFASASTNLNAGNVVLNTPAPVSGNTTAMLHVKSGGTDRWQIGDCAALAGANGGCMWGNPTRTATNFVLLATASGNTNVFNAGTTLDLDVNGTVVAAATANAFSVSNSTLSLSRQLLVTSPPTIACGTGGTQTVAANPPPGLIVTSGTLGSNCTIDFGTNATSGIFVLDMSGVTLGATFGVNFKNGSVTSTTITSSNVLAGSTLATVWTHGANTLASSY